MTANAKKNQPVPVLEALRRENEELKWRLSEAEETLGSIRRGEVDAVVVSGPAGEQVFTLKGADQVYRTILETMSEGACVLDRDGVIIYSNLHLGEMLNTPQEKILAAPFKSCLFSESDRIVFDRVLAGSTASELNLLVNGTAVPVRVSACGIELSGAKSHILVITDISALKRNELELQALANELKRSRDDLRQLASELVLAEERERKKIALVLHDEVAQTLAAARLRVDALTGVPGDDEYRKTVSEAHELLVAAIQKTRSLMTTVSSPVLYDIGLDSALEALADQVTAGRDIRVDYAFSGNLKDLGPDLKVTFYQIIRELLQNVVKHSRAKAVKVRVKENGNSIRAAVADNGKGFDVDTLRTPDFESGFGLFSIRERLKFFNGKIEILSQRGKGTRVNIEIPK